jgi:signal peptidase I
MKRPAHVPRPNLKRRERGRELLNLALFFVASYVLLEMTVPRSVVQSVSMQPALVEDQRLLISRLNYLFGNPQRGDIVVFVPPATEADATAPLIKRLIGLPGETISLRHQQVYIGDLRLEEPYLSEPCAPEACPDEAWILGVDEYFMMGDNRNHSRDSRAFGPVQHSQLVGQAILRWWPPALWANLTYNRTTLTDVP